MVPAIYAVIDTNVLVSAMMAKRDDSPPVIIVNKIFDGTLIPVISNAIFAEYTEVLHRNKFGFDDYIVNIFLQELRNRGIIITVTQNDFVLPDMNDVPFYAATITHGIDRTFLITGNVKHFPVAECIVTPAQFIHLNR